MDDLEGWDDEYNFDLDSLAQDADTLLDNAIVYGWPNDAVGITGLEVRFASGILLLIDLVDELKSALRRYKGYTYDD